MSHVRLAPSAAHRWMECPGSIAAEAGYKDTGSVHAREGTAAHELAEWCLTTARSPYDRLGDLIEVEGQDFEVTEEMAEAVRLYANVCGEYLKDAVIHGVEERVDLAPLGPPDDMQGTADFWAYRKKAKELVVCDLKYGKGVTVSAEDNPQAMYYALGVWVHLMTSGVVEGFDKASVQMVRILIVQPRQTDEEGEPRVSEFNIPLDELRLWAKSKLLPAARAAMQEGAERVSGDHCRWCAAKADCATFRGVALAVAEQEFEILVDPEQEPALPAVQDLTPEQVSVILDKAPLLEEWVSAVRGRAESMLESGAEVPGWARKPKRATRKWKNESGVQKWLLGEYGADKEEMFDWKFKSPAQIEKMVGKGTIPGEFVVAESSGFNLCRDSDPKALPSGVIDFDVIVE